MATGSDVEASSSVEAIDAAELAFPPAVDTAADLGPEDSSVDKVDAHADNEVAPGSVNEDMATQDGVDNNEDGANVGFEDDEQAVADDKDGPSAPPADVPENSGDATEAVQSDPDASTASEAGEEDSSLHVDKATVSGRNISVQLPPEEPSPSMSAFGAPLWPASRTPSRSASRAPSRSASRGKSITQFQEGQPTRPSSTSQVAQSTPSSPSRSGSKPTDTGQILLSSQSYIQVGDEVMVVSAPTTEAIVAHNQGLADLPLPLTPPMRQSRGTRSINQLEAVQQPAGYSAFPSRPSSQKLSTPTVAPAFAGTSVGGTSGKSSAPGNSAQRVSSTASSSTSITAGAQPMSNTNTPIKRSGSSLKHSSVVPGEAGGLDGALGSHVPVNLMQAADTMVGQGVTPHGPMPPHGMQPQEGMMPPPGMMLPGGMLAPQRSVLPPAPRAPAGASPFSEWESPYQKGQAGGTHKGPGRSNSAGRDASQHAGLPNAQRSAPGQASQAAESRSAPSSARKLPVGSKNVVGGSRVPQNAPEGRPAKHDDKSSLLGLTWAEQQAALHVEQARKAEAFRGLFCVQGMKGHGAPREQPTHLNPKQKRTVPGRIKFTMQAMPPSNTGGGTLPPDRIMEGLNRRKAAAMYMNFGIYQAEDGANNKVVERPPTPEGIQLDGFVLLEAGDDEFPEGVTAVKLAHRNITSLESTDMSYFIALKVIDLSDNRVPDLNCLAPLPVLRNCNLATNRLKLLGDINPEVAFQHLEVLDLSYNLLSADELLGVHSPLGYLPRLRELDASGNGLKSLPEEVAPFQNLEVLKLGDNALKGQSLSSLAPLPSLCVLSLAHNIISAIPNNGSLSPSTSFLELQVLDLSHNRIADKDALRPLRGLPNMQRLLLAGNPLAVQAVAAAKKQKDRKSLLEDAAHGGTALNFSDVALGMMLPSELEEEQVVQYKAEGMRKVSIASTLVGGRMVTINKGIDHQAAGRDAAAAAVAAAPDEALVDAFERIDGAIDAWALNTVEEEGEEGEEDDGPVEDDYTFLTGVGISEKVKHSKQEAAPEEAPPPTTAPRPVWEDVEDPTERLALALGLDPRRLSIYTGKLTIDSVGSINALRFALNHPLVQADEGLVPTQHHLVTTAAARLKQRKKLEPLALAPKRKQMPTSKAGQSKAAASLAAEEEGLPADAHVVRVQTIGGMLSGMKDRLKALESNLTKKLADAPEAEPPLSSKTKKSTSRPAETADAGKTERSSEDKSKPEGDKVKKDEEEDEEESDDMEDAQSDMSALPDDVIDAIENPDLSDSADDEDEIFAEDDADEEGMEGGNSAEGNGSGEGAASSLAADPSMVEKRRGEVTAGVGPAAASAAASAVSAAYHGVNAAGGASLGYS